MPAGGQTLKLKLRTLKSRRPERARNEGSTGPKRLKTPPAPFRAVVPAGGQRAAQRPRGSRRRAGARPHPWDASSSGNKCFLLAMRLRGGWLKRARKTET
jgi:hypothetical protein